MHFQPDSAQVPTAQASQQLDELAAFLIEHDNVALELRGHSAIPSPSEQAAIDVSRQRADAVAAYLVAAGVDAERITTVGVGSAEPIADNSTEAGAAENRRVTFRIKEQN